MIEWLVRVTSLRHQRLNPTQALQANSYIFIAPNTTPSIAPFVISQRLIQAVVAWLLLQTPPYLTVGIWWRLDWATTYKYRVPQQMPTLTHLNLKTQRHQPSRQAHEHAMIMHGARPILIQPNVLFQPSENSSSKQGRKGAKLFSEKRVWSHGLHIPWWTAWFVSQPWKIACPSLSVCASINISSMYQSQLPHWIPQHLPTPQRSQEVSTMAKSPGLR